MIIFDEFFGRSQKNGEWGFNKKEGFKQLFKKLIFYSFPPLIKLIVPTITDAPNLNGIHIISAELFDRKKSNDRI